MKTHWFPLQKGRKINPNFWGGYVWGGGGRLTQPMILRWPLLRGYILGCSPSQYKQREWSLILKCFMSSWWWRGIRILGRGEASQLVLVLVGEVVIHQPLFMWILTIQTFSGGFRLAPFFGLCIDVMKLMHLDEVTFIIFLKDCKFTRSLSGCFWPFLQS